MSCDIVRQFDEISNELHSNYRHPTVNKPCNPYHTSGSVKDFQIIVDVSKNNRRGTTSMMYLSPVKIHQASN